MQKAHIYRLDSLRLSPSYQTQRTLTEIEQMSKRYPHQTQRKRWHWEGLVSVKTSHPPFFRTTPLFYQPLPFYEKNLNLPFLGGNS